MTIWCIRIACWIAKATNAHTQVVQYSLLFNSNSCCMNAPQRYVICTLPVLLENYPCLMHYNCRRHKLISLKTNSVLKQFIHLLSP